MDRSSKPRRPLRRWKRRALLTLTLGLVSFNAIACLQARAMLYYAPFGSSTSQIETSSLGAKLRTLFFGVQVPRPANLRTPAAVGLAYETHAIPSARGDLEGWFVPQPGAAGVAVLFHGYAAGKESLLTPATTFYALGYSVLLVDFHGSGGSPGSMTTLGVREADDVWDTVQYVQRRWPDQPLVLYGFSMGAAALARALASHPIQADAVILEALFDRLINTTRHRFGAMGLPAFPSAEVLLFWGSLNAGINGFGLNPVDDVGRISAPTLLLHGQSDPRVSSAELQILAAHFPTPPTLLDVPNVGHEPIALASPDVWQAAISAFLARHLPR
jgi:alpha-beta hydrolase superfamily lysophospholipase